MGQVIGRAVGRAIGWSSEEMPSEDFVDNENQAHRHSDETPTEDFHDPEYHWPDGDYLERGINPGANQHPDVPLDSDYDTARLSLEGSTSSAPSIQVATPSSPSLEVSTGSEPSSTGSVPAMRRRRTSPSPQQSRLPLRGRPHPPGSRMRRCVRGTYNSYLFLVVQTVFILLCAGGYCAAQHRSKKNLSDPWFKDNTGLTECNRTVSGDGAIWTAAGNQTEGVEMGRGNQTAVFVTGVYYVITSFTTVGFGDITPDPNNVKALIVTCFLVFLGVLIMSLCYMEINLAIDRFEDYNANRIIECAIKRRANDRDMGLIFGLWVKFVEWLRAKKSIKEVILIRAFMATIYAVLLTILGMAILRLVEHMSFWESLYAAVISETTVGYGDITFKSQAGRAFASVWLILSAATTSRVFDLLVQTRVHRRSRLMLHTSLTPELLRDFGISQESSHLEFWKKRLIAATIIDEYDIDNIDAQWRKFTNT